MLFRTGSFNTPFYWTRGSQTVSFLFDACVMLACPCTQYVLVCVWHLTDKTISRYLFYCFVLFFLKGEHLLQGRPTELFSILLSVL